MTAGADERPVMQDVGQGYKIWANSPVTTAAGQAGRAMRPKPAKPTRPVAVPSPSHRAGTPRQGAVTSAAAWD